MRNFVAATVAAIFVATSALAATDAGPLPAGKPAGVKKAQEDDTVWWVVGVGVVAAGIALVASGDSDNPAAGTVTTSTATTTKASATTST